MTDDPIRVLMVEDQTDLREMIGLALRELGIDVATTADGHEAAELLKGEARFDVVFSDVSMPNGMSGIELSEHVAREQPQARMILSSGYARSQLPPLPEHCPSPCARSRCARHRARSPPRSPLLSLLMRCYCVRSQVGQITPTRDHPSLDRDAARSSARSCDRVRL